MERLTDKHWRNMDPWECCGQDNHCARGCHDSGGCTNGCIVPKIYTRLGAYEDIGLTPEEVAEPARAKAEGQKDLLTIISERPASCVECKHGRSYGAVGDRYCRILTDYFTGNIAPPHKEKPDECPLYALEYLVMERDQYKARAADAEAALAALDK